MNDNDFDDELTGAQAFGCLVVCVTLTLGMFAAVAFILAAAVKYAIS